MENNEIVKNIIKVSTKLQNLCEGFDIDSKSTLISSKIKILLFVQEQKRVSPSMLIDKVGLAKSNLALLCKNLVKEELIASQKDQFDSRVVFYSLTEKGNEYLNESLSAMTNNFKRELAYKNKFKEIDKLLCELKEIIY